MRGVHSTCLFSASTTISFHLVWFRAGILFAEPLQCSPPAASEALQSSSSHLPRQPLRACTGLRLFHSFSGREREAQHSNGLLLPAAETARFDQLVKHEEVKGRGFGCGSLMVTPAGAAARA
jgi:hypothetical protein